MPRAWKRRSLGPSTGRAKRRYKRLYARLRRQDRAFRRAEAQRSKVYRALKPETAEEAGRRWREQNRDRQRRYNRRYHRLYRARRCDFCGRVPRHGSHKGSHGCPGNGCGLELVERLVPGAGGNLVAVKMKWCGKC